MDTFTGPLGGSVRGLKAYYGALGDGVQDNQGHLQQAVNDLVAGQYRTLYVEAGNYRCTAGVYMNNTGTTGEYLNIIGEDPTTTRIFWDAAPFEWMALFNMAGVHYSRVSRIRFDGGGNAWAGIRVDGHPTGYFPTGNEFSDIVVHGCQNNVLLQRIQAIGVSEAYFKRCRFYGATRADVFHGGFNTLDIWFWDCSFEGGAIALCNNDRVVSGAGNFHAYRCLFDGYTDAAVLIGNTQGHNFTDCWFRNCNRAYDSYGIGAASPSRFQRCTILDSAQPITVSQANAGPLFFFDNTVRSLSPTETTYTAGSPNMIRGGNTYSSTGQAAGTRDLIFDTETVVSRASITPTWPTWVGHAARTTPSVFNVPAGSSTATMQTAIDDAVAAGAGSIVYFHGSTGAPPSHSVTSTLTVPAGAAIQLIGAGRSTELKWTGGGAGPIIDLLGPGNHATIKDIRFHGNDLALAIRANNADQIGGRVFLEQPFAEQNTVGWRFDHLTDTKVELRGDGAGSTGVAVDPGTGMYVNAAEVVQWGGAYGTNWNTCWSVKGGGRLAIFDTWYEGEPPEEVRLGHTAYGASFPSGVFVRFGGIQVAPDANHGGNKGPNDATVHVQDFAGRVTNLASGLGVLCDVRRWQSRHAASLLVAGAIGTLQPYYIDEQTNTRGARLASWRNSVEADNPPYSVGTALEVPDLLTGLTTAQRGAFVKEHFAWLRTLAPMSTAGMSSYTAGVTNIQLYKVDLTRCTTGLDVRGTVPTLSGTPSAADAYSQKVTLLFTLSEDVTVRKHMAFIDPLGGATARMRPLAATFGGGATHRWCCIRMTPLQQEELEARLAAQITAQTVKVYDSGETPQAILTANNLEYTYD